MIRRHVLFQALLAIMLLVASANSFDLQEACYDSELIATVLPVDTVKGLAVFAYALNNGWHLDSMSLMLDWMFNIWNPADSGSIPNFYLSSSFNKHMLIGQSMPDRDTMFVSAVQLFPLANFFLDIMIQLDSLVDFRNFDLTGPNGVPDGIVDMLFFNICNYYHCGGRSHLPSSYTSQEGTLIAHGVYQFFFNKDYQLPHGYFPGGRPYGQGLMQHEYGHMLGFVDTDHSDCTFKHHATGAFDGMFAGVPSPNNPYWRDITVDWIDVKIVNSPVYNYEIEYWTTSDSSIYVLHDASIDPHQKFYLISHKGTSYFDEMWPSPNSGGLLIYHVRTNRGWGDNPRRKNIDVEIASGLYDWYIDICAYCATCSDSLTDPSHLYCWPSDESLSVYIDQPNPAYGLDSLDVRGRCKSLWSGQPGMASINSFFDGITYTNFDDFSNPSSKFYNAQDSQVVWSHLAVRNIHTRDSKVYADLLVNNWYGVLDSSMIWGHATIDKGYAITGDITVQSGDTLRILPGTTVYFQTGEDNQSGGYDDQLSELIVNGTLIAQGTPQRPIRFVSSSSQYDSGAPGDWPGLYVGVGAKAIISNAQIGYAINGIEMKNNAVVTLSHVDIADCQQNGIYN